MEEVENKIQQIMKYTLSPLNDKYSIQVLINKYYNKQPQLNIIICKDGRGYYRNEVKIDLFNEKETSEELDIIINFLKRLEEQ